MGAPTSGKVKLRSSTDPDFFSRASSFPTTVGSLIGDGKIRGYYLDFRFKAEEPPWPPSWLESREEQLHVSTAQWALGAYEHYLHGGGEEWLAGARGAADYFLSEMERGGPLDGAIFHGHDMRHTFYLPAPWVSAMAQGEIASVLVRLYLETGEERYAEGARRALVPMRVPTSRGGSLAELDGGAFYEEYPTDPASYVLNGGIFALWGLHDVAVGLDDPQATEEWQAGVETLARNIERWDTGYWSTYDLFPHPVRNIASSAYHALHITQLKGMDRIAPRPEFKETISRFEKYQSSRFDSRRAFALKVLFRLIVPRNRRLAHRLPWTHFQRDRRVKNRRMIHSVVLCYHAVSHGWPSVLSVSPERLRFQLEFLLQHGYQGATFAEVVLGDAPAKAVAVTFDDGFRSVFNNAFPIMRELGLPATIFVPTGLIGNAVPLSWQGPNRWLGTEYESELTPVTWDELRQLQTAGWEVASHSKSHSHLPELGDAALQAELLDSRDKIAAETGEPCLSMAYPYGDSDERVRDAVREAGYAGAAALRPGRPDPLAWPRIDIYPADDPWRFRLKVSPWVRRFRSSRLGQGLERRRHRQRRPS